MFLILLNKLTLFCDSVINSVANYVLNLGLDDHMVLTKCPADDKDRFSGLLLGMNESISLQCEQSRHFTPVHCREIVRLSNLEWVIVLALRKVTTLNNVDYSLSSQKIKNTKQKGKLFCLTDIDLIFLPKSLLCLHDL